MKIRFFVFVVLCLYTYYAGSKSNIQSTATFNKATLSKSDIDHLLNETNQIRTVDFAGFSKNLNELSALVGNFTKEQNCFYRFLSAYKLGLSGDIQKSIQQLKKIKTDCDFLSINIRVDSLLANIYAISGDYQLALTNLDSALVRVEDNDNKQLEILVYSTAFVVYDLVSQNQLSLDFAQIVLDKNPAERHECSASVYKHVSLIKLNRIKDQENEIARVLKFCRQQNENIIAEALNVNWIEYQLAMSNSHTEINKVYQSLLASNDSIKATQYKNLIVFKDSLMAKILEKMERYEEAVEFAEKALMGSVSLGNTEQKIDALDILVNYHQRAENYKEANKYLLDKNLTEVKFYSEKQEKQMAYQTIKHDNMAKTNQIDFLNQENDMLILEKELAEKSRSNQLLLSYLFGSLAILLLYIGYRIKKQQEIYKSLSEMDHMTKIFNRKGMRDYMEYMLPYSEKKDETIAFGVFDLDYFKKVNDRYGHTVGDWVIQTTVESCKALENEKATFARLGGEEFAIILRDSSFDEIAEFSESCRAAIHSIETHYDTGHQFKVSASFGITTTKISGYDFSCLMSDADNALYESKENGRNKVTVFNPVSQRI